LNLIEDHGELHDIDLAGHGEEHDDHSVGFGRKLTFSVFVCMIGGQLILHFTEYVGLPYTPIVFIVAIIIGASNSLPDKFYYDFLFQLDPDFLLLLFLPALIYESASSVDWHTFKRQSGKIMLMAFPMLLAATYLTALVMFHILNYKTFMPWSACVLFGAVISATDPVAVVSLLKELGAPKSMATLIEGESLMNDGTAVVIFYVAIEFVSGKELTIG
jgi:NhaP-type Na+/H+ or K+/H+ antiporter